MGKSLFNFSNGTMNLLCTNCSKVVRTAKDFTEKDWQTLSSELTESTYCVECENLTFELEKNSKEINKLEVLSKILPYMNENPDFKENLIDIASKKMFKDLNSN